uniref:Uncharacterized protein n=1 Tax=Uncultured archaeon GZfos26G2 TaxID=3386331 RepID=Q64C41_UNCAG|nr:hypothetical protein GZ26D6_12 [uncultured archaeon GZfos26D6]
MFGLPPRSLLFSYISPTIRRKASQSITDSISISLSPSCFTRSYSSLSAKSINDFRYIIISITTYKLYAFSALERNLCIFLLMIPFISFRQL